MSLPVFDPRALYVARVTRGMSRAALAERAEVDRTTIYRLEKGQVQPRPDSLAALATALEISTLDLLTDEVAA